jgi:hypothetical protein
MYWVAIGAGVAVGGGIIASLISKRIWPGLATASVAGGMYLLYVHARNRGKARADQPGTEGY